MKPDTHPLTLMLNARLKQRVNLDKIIFLEGNVNYTFFHFQSCRRTIIAYPPKHFEADLLP